MSSTVADLENKVNSFARENSRLVTGLVAVLVVVVIYLAWKHYNEGMTCGCTDPSIFALTAGYAENKLTAGSTMRFAQENTQGGLTANTPTQGASLAARQATNYPIAVGAEQFDNPINTWKGEQFAGVGAGPGRGYAMDHMDVQVPVDARGQGTQIVGETARVGADPTMDGLFSKLVYG